MPESEITPVANYSAFTAQDLDTAPNAVPLSHYGWVLRRHAWKIALFVVVCVSATFLVSKRLTALYESTAIVDVDRQAPLAVIGQESAHAGGPSDADQFISTQIKLIQSDAVLRPVASKYRLLEQEGQVSSRDLDATRRTALAPITLKRLSINRPPNTYLLQVIYRSPDPQQAADVANAVAESFLQTAYTQRARSSQDLAAFMAQQLDGLKSKMDSSGRALAAFEKELNVINPEEKTSILSARLLQLNTEYTSAQAERVRKEAVWNSVKSGSLASVQTSGQAESLAQLNQHLNEVEERFAAVKTTYGSTHPEYKKAASAVAEMRRQFEDMQKNIGDRVGVDYEQALHREQMLQAAVTQTKADYDRLNARSYQYQELKREAEADKRIYEELTTKINEGGINAGFQNNMIRIADHARPAAHPVFPTTRMNLALAFLLSMVIACAAALLSDAIDTTVRDPEQVSKYLGIDVIGTLPAVKSMAENNLLGVPDPGRALLTATDAVRSKLGSRKAGRYCTLSHYGEAIRTVRSTIFLSDFDGRLRSILVTSATPGEGKTTTAVNLAIAHAGQGNRTLVIDADLRRPSVHRRLAIPEGPGFSDVLAENVPWRETVRQIEAVPQLSVIPAGPPSHRAADLIGPRIGALLDEVAREYDLVIIDAPSLLGFADPLQMAKVADGVLVVSEAGVTRRDAVSRAVAMLDRVRANVLGVVLNRVRPHTSNSYSEAYVEYRHSTAA